MTQPVNLEEFEPLARSKIDRGPYDYYAGGADDEITLRENREEFRRTFLKYRVLVDVHEIDTRTRVLGTELQTPILLAPTALHKMAHPDGEVATARGAAQAGVLQTLSSVSSVAMEEVADAAPGSPRWFQLYVYTRREKAEELVKRAEAAGYSGIALTVDLPVLGRRERDLRNAFETPPGITAAHVADIVGEGGTPADLLAFDATLSWDDIAWLKSLSSLPLILKGIVRADDARRAVEAGADAIWVSNHGGRQLDTSVPTLRALPSVVQAVDHRVPVILDGGVRRGTDVLKGLALGADAVAIGRPQLWGLAVGGADGVRTVVQMLRDELVHAMMLAGCPSLKEIDASLIA